AQYRNVIKTLPEDVTENLRPGFATLLTAVGFVWLIACSNVANLLLVRFSGRRREISLRLALGATRGSVLRLFVFESVLISLLAGVLSAALAWQLVPLVPKLAANFLPIEQGNASALSVPVLFFTIGLSLVTGFAMGLYPALHSSRADLVDALKEGGRGTQGSVRQQRFRKLLVGAQVALSATLLGGAALNDIMPGWFRAAGIPLIAGRDFNEQDVMDHPNVIIISTAGAKTVFGDENPIGKTLLITNGSVPVEIVGVVGDVRSVQLNQ